jgi:hypothetical protein
MEDKINGSFRVMIENHPYQTLGRAVGTLPIVTVVHHPS